MEDAHTLIEDSNAHIAYPNNSQRKIQCAVRTILNVVEGDNRCVCSSMTSKVIPKGMCRKCKIIMWDPRDLMHFQKNAWVETVTVMKISNRFVQEKTSKHGSKQTLTTLDNLAALYATELKKICREFKVLLFYLTKDTTESTYLSNRFRLWLRKIEIRVRWNMNSFSSFV